jgi:hypothetical protein
MLEGLKPPPNKAYYCRVSQVLSELDQADQEILDQAIADYRSWPAKTLQNALKERGLTLADTTITKHRNQLCACAKDD